jgi:hypothetical protein
VTFLRDRSGGIIAYTLKGDTFSLITNNIHFPVQMWFPRMVANPESFSYHYSRPEQLNDGLSTAGLEGSGLDARLLATMIARSSPVNTRMCTAS